MLLIAQQITPSTGFHLSVDLGQVIISGCIGIIGYFVKRTIESFGKRLDRHEDILFNMSQDLQRVIGQVSLGPYTGPNRRIKNNDK